jgi:hypothetical protein
MTGWKVYSTNTPGPPDRVDRAWFTTHQLTAMHNVDLTIERLRSGGATIEEANAPPGFESAHPVQRHIMVFEAARNLGPDVARAPETRQRCLPVDDRERRAPPGARGSHAVTLPSGTGPAGLPLGLQICAAPGSDRALVDAARTWAA